MSRAEPDAANPKQWAALDVPTPRMALLASVCFANVVLAVMGDLLFSGSRVLSAPGGGIDARFAALRAFTAEAIAAGQMPLWNPAIFSGTPHLGGFESGVYYPINVLYGVLPLPMALNAAVAVHLFLFALFTFLWLRRHSMHPIAATYGGIAAMLTGAYFSRAVTGDLAVVEAFTWTPAALLAMHYLSHGRFAPGIIGGVVSLSMPVLCGYPIATAYMAATVCLYGWCLLWLSANRRVMIRGSLIVLTAVPLLTAAQLLPGIETFFRSVRFRGDAAAFVVDKALSKDDLLAVVAPWSLDGVVSPGATPLYFGLLTLLAAAYGLAFAQGRFRFGAAGIALVLLIGAALPYIPTFADAPVLRHMVAFRSFAIPAAVFAIALAAVGLDALIRRPNSATFMAAIAIAMSVALCVTATVTHLSGDSGEGAFRAYLMSAGILTCGAALLSLVKIDPRFRFAVLALGVIELYVFAILHRPSVPIEVGDSTAALQNGTREMNLDWRNPGPRSGILSASGNAALPSTRYMELLAHTQWSELPKRWEGPFDFVGYHPIHRMLRVDRVTPNGTNAEESPISDALPRFLLLSGYEVVGNWREAFAIMEQPAFDPSKTVILEREPNPKPRGTVSDDVVDMTDQSINAFTIELTLDNPAILLITDAYDRNWKAEGLSGSAQWQYDVLPANVALRAIPLGAGAHRIRMEYAPVTHRVGRWLSLVTIAALSAYAAIAVRRRSKALNQISNQR